MFIDRVTLQLHAGKGGNGVVAWTRAKFVPKGGPCGGNGSKGGSVIIEADVQVPSLDYYRNRRILKAENGGAGGPNCRQGKVGKDLVLKVPCGTLIKDIKTGQVLADLTESGQQFIACRGGRGGRGNASFASPTRQAPNFATEGLLGETSDVELELKLIADVGLVGFPNAGKSTLIHSLAQVPVKIAAYPFTTLKPNLGYYRFKTGEKVLLADIPGIISGAHEDRGLGFEFLRHIERTKMLLFVIDMSGIDGRSPHEDYAVLRKELKLYNEELLNKPYLILLNKIDTEEAQENLPVFYKKFAKEKKKIIEISAQEKTHLDKLATALKEMLFS